MLSKYGTWTMVCEPFFVVSDKIEGMGSIQPPHLNSYNSLTEMLSFISILSKFSEIVVLWYSIIELADICIMNDPLWCLSSEDMKWLWGADSAPSLLEMRELNHRHAMKEEQMMAGMYSQKALKLVINDSKSSKRPTKHHIRKIKR